MRTRTTLVSSKDLSASSSTNKSSPLSGNNVHNTLHLSWSHFLCKVKEHLNNNSRMVTTQLNRVLEETELHFKGQRRRQVWRMLTLITSRRLMRVEEQGRRVNLPWRISLWTVQIYQQPLIQYLNLAWRLTIWQIACCLTKWELTTKYVWNSNKSMRKCSKNESQQQMHWRMRDC